LAPVEMLHFGHLRFPG